LYGGAGYADRGSGAAATYKCARGGLAGGLPCSGRIAGGQSSRESGC